MDRKQRVLKYTLVTEVQRVVWGAGITPDEGQYKISYLGNKTAFINYDADPAAVQTALRLVSGLSAITTQYYSSTPEGDGFEITFTGVVGDASLIEITDNTVKASSADLVPTVTEETAGNATLVDMSEEFNDWRSSSGAWADTIYIGAELPFNHKYFEMSTVNAGAKVLSSVEYWSGSAWVEAVDIKDGTLTGGKALAQSGAISWARDPNEDGWGKQQDSTLIEGDLAVDGAPRIFNLYWVRMTWSTVASTFACRYIGECFSVDEDLFDLYGDLRSTALMGAYKSGKTDWKDQAFAAGDAIVQHLRRNNVIVRREQIMDSTLFKEASVHKTAQIIMNGLGNGYFERARMCEQAFARAVNIKYPEVDTAGTGEASSCDKGMSTTWGTR